MNRSNKPFRPFRFGLVLGVSVPLFSILFGFVYLRLIDPPETIQITFATNGTARLHGIPVSNRAVRRCVFWLASLVRDKDTQIVIYTPTENRPLLQTNELAVMLDLGRAGLTNR